MKAFLHIGAGKTGTSVIQAALARHRRALAAAGLVYPDAGTASDQRAAKGQISSGNAVRLAWLFRLPGRPPGFDEAATRAWLDGCIQDAGGRDLLFSSELLQLLPREGVHGLVGLLRASGCEPVVIYYARHLLDHAVSVYLQHLKQGFATMPARERTPDLGAAVRQYRCPFPRALEPYAALLPPEALMVRLYDAAPDRLVSGFFDLLPGRLQVEDAPSEVINRSPSPAEQAVFERLAALPDAPRLCRALTDLVLNRPHPAGTRFGVAAEDFAVFAKHNEPAVEEMNRRYLPPDQELRLTSGQIAVGPLAPPTPDEIQDAFTECLALLLRERIAQPQAATARPVAAGSPRARRQG
jgi:hypothetical protein